MAIETKRMAGWCIGAPVTSATVARACVRPGREARRLQLPIAGADRWREGSSVRSTDSREDEAGVEMLNWGCAARQIGRERWAYGAHGAAPVRRSVLGRGIYVSATAAVLRSGLGAEGRGRTSEVAEG